jgi:hypothetical protein
MPLGKPRRTVVDDIKMGLHKVRGISWLAEELLAAEEGLCSMELVSYLVRVAKLCFISLVSDGKFRMISTPNR